MKIVPALILLLVCSHAANGAVLSFEHALSFNLNNAPEPFEVSNMVLENDAEGSYWRASELFGNYVTYKFSFDDPIGDMLIFSTWSYSSAEHISTTYISLQTSFDNVGYDDHLEVYRGFYPPHTRYVIRSISPPSMNHKELYVRASIYLNPIEDTDAIRFLPTAIGSTAPTFELLVVKIVPEPNTVVLLLIGCCWMGFRRPKQ